MHKNAAIRNLARALPIKVAVVRRPLSWSGSMSITSPKIWECIANIAPNKNEQVACLNQHIQRRAAFPSDARRIVEADGQEQQGVPPQNARPDEEIERNHEWDLHHGNLPSQCCELFARTARTKHESAFARVQ